MRIYKNFKEAHSEVLRDVVEMGIRVSPKSMQDKIVEGNPDYQTLEVQNYIYTVVEPRAEDLNPNQPWADAEFMERLDPYFVNPGTAWKHRPEVWTEFMHDGEFAYTYNERFNNFDGLEKIISRIKNDPDSRQLFLSVWDPSDIENLGGSNRVPCSLGYIFQVRGNQVNLTYLMRSCDAYTHFHNDVYLAFKLLSYVATRTGYKVGTFTHYMASLHIYKKDTNGIF